MVIGNFSIFLFFILKLTVYIKSLFKKNVSNTKIFFFVENV